MKKIFILLLSVLCLVSCNKNSVATDNVINKSLTSVTKADAKTLAKETDYVDVENIKTDFGIVEIPHINKNVKETNDVQIANSLFKYIKDKLLSDVEIFKKKVAENEEQHYDYGKISQVDIKINKDILSILLRYYDIFDYYSPDMNDYEVVNIDLKTGKFVSYDEILKKSGFTEENVENSIKKYVNITLDHFFQEQKFFDFAADEKLPEGFGGPEIMWQDQIDEAMKDFRAGKKSVGKDFDILRKSPMVFFKNEGDISIRCNIPIPAGAGVSYMMLNVGKNDADVIYKNPNYPLGEKFRKYPMSPDAATTAVAEQLLDKTGKTKDGVKLNFMAEKLKTICIDDITSPYYMVRAYENMDDHIATYGYFQVNVFTGGILEENIVNGKYKKNCRRQERTRPLRKIQSSKCRGYDL